MRVKSLNPLKALGLVTLAVSIPQLAVAANTSIACPDISLPSNNNNHYFSVDADSGTCVPVSSEQEHPHNGYNMYSYFYEYNGFTITETRGSYYREGKRDNTGTFKVGCQKDSCTQHVKFIDGAKNKQSLSLTQSYSGRSVKEITANLSSSIGACNGLTGGYGNVTTIKVGTDGKTVTVTLDGGRPNAYGTCDGKHLTVNFADVNAVVNGTFDGTTIQWDNGTSWTKQ